MKTAKLNIKGSQINKIYFSDIEYDLEEKGFDIDTLFDLMADDNECIYVSNGFLTGLKSENEPGEWHHYFIKENDFEAKRLTFKNK